MITEIIKGVIAIIIIGAAIASVFIMNAVAQNLLIPLAGFAFGYYFKQAEAPLVLKAKIAFGKKQTETKTEETETETK